MNIRDAILKAADHIERHPTDFSFNKIFVPSCGTPGCALGWICAFAGISAGDSIWYERIPGFVQHSSVFYSRMNDLVGHAWKRDAAVCARGMRLYADKYHPAEKPERNFARELMAGLPAERIPDEVAS
jgi:hypothetical protein